VDGTSRRRRKNLWVALESSGARQPTGEGPVRFLSNWDPAGYQAASTRPRRPRHCRRRARSAAWIFLAPARHCQRHFQCQAKLAGSRRLMRPKPPTNSRKPRILPLPRQYEKSRPRTPRAGRPARYLPLMETGNLQTGSTTPESQRDATSSALNALSKKLARPSATSKSAARKLDAAKAVYCKPGRSRQRARRTSSGALRSDDVPGQNSPKSRGPTQVDAAQ